MHHASNGYYLDEGPRSNTSARPSLLSSHTTTTMPRRNSSQLQLLAAVAVPPVPSALSSGSSRTNLLLRTPPDENQLIPLSKSQSRSGGYNTPAPGGGLGDSPSACPFAPRGQKITTMRIVAFAATVVFLGVVASLKLPRMLTAALHSKHRGHHPHHRHVADRTHRRHASRHEHHGGQHDQEAGPEANDASGPHHKNTVEGYDDPLAHVVRRPARPMRDDGKTAVVAGGGVGAPQLPLVYPSNQKPNPRGVKTYRVSSPPAPTIRSPKFLKSTAKPTPRPWDRLNNNNAEHDRNEIASLSHLEIFIDDLHDAETRRPPRAYRRHQNGELLRPPDAAYVRAHHHDGGTTNTSAGKRTASRNSDNTATDEATITAAACAQQRYVNYARCHDGSLDPTAAQSTKTSRGGDRGASAMTNAPRQPAIRRLTDTGVLDPSLLHATTMSLIGPRRLRQPVLGLTTPSQQSGRAVLGKLVEAMATMPSTAHAEKEIGFHIPLRFGFRRTASGAEEDEASDTLQSSAADNADDEGRNESAASDSDSTTSPDSPTATTGVAPGSVSWIDGPFLDVVVTYVDETAPGFVEKAYRFAEKEDVAIDRHRFRDLGELRYLIRSLHRHGNRLIRRIVLVVADEGHVPKWINRTSTEIPFAFVTHAELFPDPVNQLPTFNSFSIETVLHRIPGLSEYFLYFNNDMLLGRRLSLLDLFRPVAGGSLADGAVDVETVLYAEKKNLPPTCELDSLMMNDVPFADRERVPTSARTVVPRLFCTTPPWQPVNPMGRGERSDFNRLYRYNKRLIWDRLGIVPTHSFAHTFKLFRRPLLEAMIDHQYADVVAATRHHRFRYVFNFWVTYVYMYYELAQRTWHQRDATGVNRAIRECATDLALQSQPLQRLSPGTDLWRRHLSVFRMGVERLVAAAWEHVFLSLSCLAATRVAHQGPKPHFDLLKLANGTRLEGVAAADIYDTWRRVGTFPHAVPRTCKPLLGEEPAAASTKESAGESTTPSTVAKAAQAKSSISVVVPCFDWDNDIAPIWFDESSVHAAMDAAEHRRALLIQYQPYDGIPAVSPIEPLPRDSIERALSAPLSRATSAASFSDLGGARQHDARRKKGTPNDTDNDRQPTDYAPAVEGRPLTGAWALNNTLLDPLRAGLAFYGARGKVHNFVEEKLFGNFFSGDGKPTYFFAIVSNIWQLHAFHEQLSRVAGVALSVTLNDDFVQVGDGEKGAMAYAMEVMAGKQPCALESSGLVVTTLTPRR